MYHKYFNRVLEEELAPYLRKGSRGLNRGKNLRQVPDSHRADPTLNSKIEDIRGSTGTRVMSPKDVNYVKSKYNISGLKPGEVKQLGTTGMKVYIDQTTGRMMIDR